MTALPANREDTRLTVATGDSTVLLYDGSVRARLRYLGPVGRLSKLHPV
ncbi:hypothetical protein ACQEV9_44150 [Streptomyces chartreusis]